MVYRTDKIVNPVQSSSNPMFAIDRNFPIVSRYEDGNQRAHININLNEKVIYWKIKDEKKSFVTFEKILDGFKLPSIVSNLLLIDNKDFNNSLLNVVSNNTVFDSLYYDFVNFLKVNKYYLDLVKDSKHLIEK